MLMLTGLSAHQSSHLQSLQKQIITLNPKIKSLQAIQLYCVESIDPNDIPLLFELLKADTTAHEMGEQTWVVLPRQGTLSPWGSKTKELALQAGITSLGHIEAGLAYTIISDDNLSKTEIDQAIACTVDPLMQSCFSTLAEIDQYFYHPTQRHLRTVPLLSSGISALVEANQQWGLALSDDEVEYLAKAFTDLNRDPTDVELMMFGQVNSEHCRHKIFNANYELENQKQPHSLFKMIKNTYAESDTPVLSAYKDNAAILKGLNSDRLQVNQTTKEYETVQEESHIVFKVETHNHPTAISPSPGAATGNGGEIRDEGATGRGGTPKAGLSGFMTSHLRLPNLAQPWEAELSTPSRMATAQQIMIEAPIGGARYNNEFGRPNLCGFFRTFEHAQSPNHYFGYHKPIMIAGGVGNIRPAHCDKKTIDPGDLLIVLGGPGMLIGLGGGAASSMDQGASDAQLDFASVQRPNPEMERRVQEVINSCMAMGDKSPIVSIHDVGAGGLCNALPELVHDADRGFVCQLEAIPVDEVSMSPMEIWCNESQERYVLAIKPEHAKLWHEICTRERCPYAVVGTAIEEQRLLLESQPSGQQPIDLPSELVFGNAPRMTRVAEYWQPRCSDASPQSDLNEVAKRVLQFPTVADKSFLITIGDRTVSGLVARDQMVGPWQVPVADCAITMNDYTGVAGEVMAVGERTPIAVISPAASSKMAVGEAITNLACARIGSLKDVIFSANWMAACGEPQADGALYEAVEAIGMDLCPDLGICIPVGKDSLSMRTHWQDDFGSKQVESPVSCIISAVAPTVDVTKQVTPFCSTDEPSRFLLIDLGNGQQRMGGSVALQVFNEIGDFAPTVDDASILKDFFDAMQIMLAEKLLLAYHDRSDGGLLATLAEMAFASRIGMDIELSLLGSDPHAILFNEELGAVIQVSVAHLEAVSELLTSHGLTYTDIGNPTTDEQLNFVHQEQAVLSGTREEWQSWWSENSLTIQAERDNPACVSQARETLHNDNARLIAKPSFDFTQRHTPTSPYRVAILREQGVNGQREMAAAFMAAGFTAIDVTMSDLIDGHYRLDDFVGLAACGGFSYGDTLGAGRGWAQSILQHSDLAEQFSTFFHRENTFALGVCNGCQMLSQLKDLIPGADHWPELSENESAQFEARVSLVRIEESPSMLLTGMAGSVLPIAVAHGEGRVSTTVDTGVAMRYVDADNCVATQYPLNPNGSVDGTTALTNADGRVTIMMPHPERVFRTEQWSWHPTGWTHYSPWQRLFDNAYQWVEQTTC